MATVQEIDPTETPLDPDVTEMQPPLSGTVDDDDEVDDERWDENEAPDRQLSATTEARDESRLDEREEDDEKAGAVGQRRASRRAPTRVRR